MTKKTPEDDRMEPIRFDENANLNLVLWGDPQISPFQPERKKNLFAACNTVATAPGRVDALALTGDIAEFGRKAEYAAAAAALNRAADKAAHIFCVTGNHDIRLRGFRRQAAVFNAFLASVRNAEYGDDDRYYFAREVNGYPFLCMGADRSAFEASYLSDRQLLWLEARLFEAEKRGVPAFVFNHQTLRRTNGLPVTWEGRGDWRGDVGRQSDRLREILTRHGTVFFCTGHLHYGIRGYNYERAGGLHLIAAPSIGCANHGENPLPCQGFVLSVYDGGAVLRGADFRNRTFMDPAMPGARTEIRF